MDKQRMDILESLMTEHINPLTAREQVLDSLLNCALCGTALNFFHSIDLANHQISEEGKCPCCGIKSKKTKHGLQ